MPKGCLWNVQYTDRSTFKHVHIHVEHRLQKVLIKWIIKIKRIILQTHFDTSTPSHDIDGKHS